MRTGEGWATLPAAALSGGKKGELRTEQVTEAKQLPDTFCLHQLIVKRMHLFLKCLWGRLLLRMAQVAWESHGHLLPVWERLRREERQPREHHRALQEPLRLSQMPGLQDEN